MGVGVMSFFSVAIKKHFHFIEIIFRFGILNFGHWNLFEIWCLYFVI